MTRLIEAIRAGGAWLRMFFARFFGGKIREPDPASSASEVNDSALFSQAESLRRQGRLDEAASIFQTLLQKHPTHFDLLHLMGMALGQGNQFEAAIGYIERAIHVDPANAGAYCSLGNCFRGMNQTEKALACYEKALALRPGDADALCNRGAMLKDLDRMAEALASYDLALQVQPNHVVALDNRGTALRELAKPEEALASHDRALALNPAYASAHYNRGLALGDIRRFDEALISYDRAIEIVPDYAGAIYNRGVMLTALNRLEEALPAFDRAITLKPDAAGIHLARSLCHLLLGHYAQGWPEYEWRWKTTSLLNTKRDFAQPMWLGDASLKGATILLHSEQGLGDTLQFCRYAKRVNALGARVLLQVQASLAPLLMQLEGVAQVFPSGAELPAFDCHCPLMSLPMAFSTDTNSIPAEVPYLQCDARQRALWQDTLNEKTKLRIGLVWSGGTGHKNDINRSMALTEIMPLIQDRKDSIEWICLQKEVHEADARLLVASTSIRVFSDRLTDFASTAALVDLLDLVITVDTSVAHLAGAMGKKVWLLLPFAPDWRWLLDRDDTPWYPTVRLFRQPSVADWASVIETVRGDLARL